MLSTEMAKTNRKTAVHYWYSHLAVESMTKDVESNIISPI